MRRYIFIILFLIAGVVTGCSTDDISKEEFANITVDYALAGSEVRSLPFNSSSQSVTIDVALNNENLYWNMESDSEWCVVVEEPHRGSGTFTVNVKANEEFVEREAATLTFVAGQYKGHTIQVTQSGNVFIVNQIYSIGSKLSGSADVQVSVAEGIEWDVLNESWLTAEKGESVTESGMVTTPVHITWDDNTASARYGKIGFCREGQSLPESQFNVFQFGNEVPYEESNDILLPSKSAQTFEIKTPAQSVESVDCPAWLTYITRQNTDNTTSYIFTMEDNPSDTRTIRESHISMKMLDKEGAVTVPVIKQEYFPVSGITSANGLRLFAQTVNEGGDLSDWQKNGEIVLLNNIDMSTTTEKWVSIGNTAHKFTGKFNGAYRKITNLSASEPLFGICDGATLKAIIIDATSSFTANDEYMGTLTLASLAGQLISCEVIECSNYAPIEMLASTGGENTKAYIGGLIAVASTGTTVSKSANHGTVKVSDKCMTAVAQGEFYIGGVAGYNKGTLTECTNNAALSDAAVSLNHYVGGIAGSSNGTIESCQNNGAINESAIRVINGVLDYSRYIWLGGVVGYNGGGITGSTNNAAITSTSDVKMQYIGGIAGALMKENPVLANNINTENGSFNIKGTNTKENSVRALSLGGLYGEITKPVSFDFTSDTSSSAGAISCLKVEPSPTTSYVYVGGLFGHAAAGADLSIINPKCASTISFNFSKENVGMMLFSAGGIIGCADAPLTITGARSSGAIDILSTTGFTMLTKTSGLGGVVGYAAKGVVLKDCINDSRVQQPTSCAKSNSYVQYMGGIAGYVAGGDSEISNCTNNGLLDNFHYNNNSYVDICNGTGGIIGGYLFSKDAATTTLAITNCTNTAGVKSYRGAAGGIIGYGRNTMISGCNNTGTMANGNRSYVAGIAGIMENSTIENCVAKCNVGGTSAGSEIFNGGGIAGMLLSGSKCSGSAFFGNIVCTTSSAGETAGGIAGTAEATTTINGCKFGGAVRETSISSSNFSTYIVGSKLMTPTACTYWDGN